VKETAERLMDLAEAEEFLNPFSTCAALEPQSYMLK
jgi:hypothetical protein